MFLTQFNNQDYLSELLKNLDYDTIINLCSSSGVLNELCRNNLLVKKIIQNKREYVQRRTNDFLETLKDKNDAIPIASNERDSDDIVNELIRRGFDPSAHDNEAIAVYSAKGNINMIDKLLQDPRVANDLMAFERAVVSADYFGQLDIGEWIWGNPKWRVTI